LENSLTASSKSNIYPSHDSVTLPLGIHPRKIKAYVHTKTHVRMYMNVLFVIGPNWKQPKCPYIHTMEYYSGTERNKLLIIQQG